MARLGGGRSDSTSVAAASSRTLTATAAARRTRCSPPGEPCRQAPTCSPTSRSSGSALLFADDAHVEAEATWAVYQRMIAAYRSPDRTKGKSLVATLITSLGCGVPEALIEPRTLGRTLERRAADVLAYFDRPGTSNGPTEAINGRLEHLPDSALACRNLTNYAARSLLETGGFRPALHPTLR